LNIPFHPEHAFAQAEVHARPFPVVRAPLRVSHLAFLTGEGTPEDHHPQLPVLALLCAALHIAPPLKAGVRFFEGSNGRVTLRWHRHTEFCSLTIFCSGPFDQPFDQTALDEIPVAMQSNLGGLVVAACHIALQQEPNPPADVERTQKTFDGHPLIGSEVVEANAVLWTDLRPRDSDGFTRFLIQNRTLSDARAGRLIQRIVELETYRLLALLALKPARLALPKLAGVDDRLGQIIEELAQVDDLPGERRSLKQLAHLAREVQHIRATTDYRCRAAIAYQELVDRRLTELRETQITGVQTLAEFLERRMRPAIRTCVSVSARIDRLSERIDHASDMLRTRIELTIEEHNQDLLTSMNRRADAQLRLQKTVEGLSVAAITYYVLGLGKYLLGGMKEAGIETDPELVLAIALPIILSIIWYAVRRRHSRLDQDGDPN